MSPRTFFRLLTHIQMMPILENGEETLVGGQAVIEGVMMRAPHSYCVAVRKPDGEIVTEQKPLARMSELHPIFKYPVLRGVGTLYQAMVLGLKALKFSANAMIEPEAARKPPGRRSIPKWAISLNLVLSSSFSSSFINSCPCMRSPRSEMVSGAEGPHRLQRHRRIDPHRHLPGIPVHHLPDEGYLPRV